MQRAATPAATSHQALKFFALALMTIDHVGAFLFPDMLWWRTVGRISAPCWFFLFGHTPPEHRRLRPMLWWLPILALLSPLLGQAVFPLNALITFIAAHFLLQRLETRQWLTRHPLTLIAAAWVFLIPSTAMMEYGTAGLAYALLGYCVRNRQHVRTTLLFALAAYGLYVAHTLAFFSMTPPQLALALGGSAVITCLLVRFRYAPLTCPNWAHAVLRFASRYSLQYYVLHRLILQGLGIAMGTLNNSFRWM